MAMPRVCVRLPLYDPSKSSLAYGDRAIPKLVRYSSLWLGTLIFFSLRFAEQRTAKHRAACSAAKPATP